MSDELIEQYKLLHQKNPGYGAGATYLSRIRKIIEKNGYDCAIDYGCGKGKLADALGIPCIKYDPAIPEYSEHPDTPVDIVICNDVLEHLTLDNYKEVIREIWFLSIHCAFFNISCRPAVHKLPNGENCHTLIRDKDWWLKELQSIMTLSIIEEYQYFEKNENLLVVMKRK